MVKKLAGRTELSGAFAPCRALIRDQRLPPLAAAQRPIRGIFRVTDAYMQTGVLNRPV